MSNAWKFILIIIAVAAVSGGLIFFASRSNNPKDDNNAKTSGTVNGENTDPAYIEKLAKYLAQKGMVMYGAYWCPHCKDEKVLFGDAFKFVDYVECDPQGPNPNPDECTAQGVDGYPTWIYNGTKYSGYKTLSQLAQIVGFTDSSATVDDSDAATTGATTGTGATTTGAATTGGATGTSD